MVAIVVQVVLTTKIKQESNDAGNCEDEAFVIGLIEEILIQEKNKGEE